MQGDIASSPSARDSEKVEKDCGLLIKQSSVLEASLASLDCLSITCLATSGT